MTMLCAEGVKNRLLMGARMEVLVAERNADKAAAEEVCPTMMEARGVGSNSVW